MQPKGKQETVESDSVRIYRHVGQRIKARRKSLNISQAHCADLMGLSYQQVQKYENGLSQIFLERLLQFAQILNVSPEYFYEGIDFTHLGTRIDSDVIQKTRTKPVHVLLVDHTPSDILMFERALQPFRGSVTLQGISDHNSALEHIRRGHMPDIVVTDALLPREGCTHLIRALKTNSQTAVIPVVVLTNSTSRKTMVEAYRLGIAGFIPKSTIADEFRDRMRAFMEYWLRAVVLP